MRKPRAKKLYTTGVAMFNPIAPEKGLFADAPTSRMPVSYYSDGSIRSQGGIIRWTETVASRPDIVQLVMYGYRQLLPWRAAVSRADYESFKHQVELFKKEQK
jgi:hypothetical protein